MDNKFLEKLLKDADKDSFQLNKKGGFRKISDPPKFCRYPGHNPPMYISLPPGTYEYTCPGCGETGVFTVPAIYF